MINWVFVQAFVDYVLSLTLMAHVFLKCVLECLFYYHNIVVVNIVVNRDMIAICIVDIVDIVDNFDIVVVV